MNISSQGAEFGITSNVHVRIVDSKTGKYKEYSGHNKATRSLLLGLYNFLRGRESATTYDYAPNELSVGAGTQSPTFLDNHLQIPLYSDGTKVDHYRSGTTVYKTEQRGKDYHEDTNSVTLAIKFYIESNELAGDQDDPTPISELGLYSKGGILLARYVFPEVILKGENDFVYILWEISLTSI